jgi:hypothetical protein
MDGRNFFASDVLRSAFTVPEVEPQGAAAAPARTARRR